LLKFEIEEAVLYKFQKPVHLNLITP